MTLTCCVCGSAAPAKKQWWNRDHGFGLCGTCARNLKARPDYNAEEFTSYYGIAGVHWIEEDPEAAKEAAAQRRRDRDDAREAADRQSWAEEDPDAGFIDDETGQRIP